MGTSLAFLQYISNSLLRCSVTCFLYYDYNISALHHTEDSCSYLLQPIIHFNTYNFSHKDENGIILGHYTCLKLLCFGSWFLPVGFHIDILQMEPYCFLCNTQNTGKKMRGKVEISHKPTEAWSRVFTVRFHKNIHSMLITAKDCGILCSFNILWKSNHLSRARQKFPLCTGLFVPCCS